MKQIFVSKYIKGFGRVMKYFTNQMIKTKEERRRERILNFWKLHGIAATKDAFRISRSTLYLWKQRQKKGLLKPQSKRPKTTRRPITSKIIIDLVSDLRISFPYLGKEKLANLCLQNGYQVSASTVGRIIKRKQLPSSPGKWISRNKKKD